MAYSVKFEPVTYGFLKNIGNYLIKSLEWIRRKKTMNLWILTEERPKLLYLDPPYNERQYAPNYHLLETIAKYDNPKIHGITGMRDYSGQKSSFCNKDSALRELDKVAKHAKYSYLLLSYNTEGIMRQQDIESILKQYGTLEIVEFEYLRFKSNNNGESKTKKHIQEQLYILKRLA